MSAVQTLSFKSQTYSGHRHMGFLVFHLNLRYGCSLFSCLNSVHILLGSIEQPIAPLSHCHQVDPSHDRNCQGRVDWHFDGGRQRCQRIKADRLSTHCSSCCCWLTLLLRRASSACHRRRARRDRCLRWREGRPLRRTGPSLGIHSDFPWYHSDWICSNDRAPLSC